MQENILFHSGRVAHSARKWMLPILALTAALLIFSPALATQLKSDEQVILFPTSGYLEDGQWVMPVHGWVFELEDDSWWRAAVIKTLRKILGLPEEAVNQEPFRSRLQMFLVDNERGKEIQLNVAGQQLIAGPSGANGHFHTAAHQSASSVVQVRPELLTVTVRAKDRPADNVTGRIQLVPAQGLSVISDIDDTIKHSQVLDKSQLVANTFVRPFSAVPGMAELYQGWARDGAAFHYVSSSPWQLYPFLRDFMSTAGFPFGSFHLKLFRLKDETVFNITASSLETKPPVIRTLFDHYPQRAFILVGDSGEHDAEIYGDIAREFPGRVRAIYIRHVTGSDVSASRFAAAFRELPNDLWHVFNDNRLPTGTGFVQ